MESEYKDICCLLQVIPVSFIRNLHRGSKTVMVARVVFEDSTQEVQDNFNLGMMLKLIDKFDSLKYTCKIRYERAFFDIGSYTKTRHGQRSSSQCFLA